MALLDPEFALTLPPRATVSTALATLYHCIETCVGHATLRSRPQCPSSLNTPPSPTPTHPTLFRFVSPGSTEASRECSAQGAGLVLQALPVLVGGARAPSAAVALPARTQLSTASALASCALSLTRAGASRGVGLAVAGRYVWVGG